MKRQYHRPELFAESFALMEHISQSCAFPTNHSQTCQFEDKNTVYFNTTVGCEDADLLWDGVADPATASYADLANLNYDCYNAPTNFTVLVSS